MDVYSSVALKFVVFKIFVKLAIVVLLRSGATQIKFCNHGDIHEIPYFSSDLLENYGLGL